MLLFFISVLLPLVFPIFKLPKPSGQYSIGTVTYHWVDSTRKELFSSDTAQQREMMVQIWYPAENAFGEKASYVDNAGALSTGLTQTLSSNGLIKLPTFFFDYFGIVKSNSIKNAPPVRNKIFPVLVYLTGLDGFRQTNTFQVESLVSHGYVVVGLDQPYTAASVTFPDARTISGLTKNAMQPLIDQSIRLHETIPMLRGHSMTDGIIPYLAQDVFFTLNQLAVLKVNGKSIVSGQLDLDRIGVFGVSLGAIVAGESGYRDQRIKALLMMDAAMPTNVTNMGLKQHAMWMTRPASDMRLERKLSGGWTEKDIKETLSTMRVAYTKTKESYYVSIEGMFHINFTDAPLWSPILEQLGLVGPISSENAFEIVNQYSLAFFNSALKSQPSTLLTASKKKYPAVSLMHH